MSGQKTSQAQLFWSRTLAAGWSDDKTRSQIRREAGVIQHGTDFIFSDGSVLRDLSVPPGRKLILREHVARAAAAAAGA